nr:hypothetical protein [uncultured Allomuricauda sp.]
MEVLLSKDSLNSVLDSLLIRKYNMVHSSFVENDFTSANMFTAHFHPPQVVYV